MSSIELHAGPSTVQISQEDEQSTTDVPAAHSWFEGGLPTPPRSRDMAGLSIAQNAAHYALGLPCSNSFSNSHPSSRHARMPSDPYPASAATQSNTPGAKASEHSKNNGIAAYLQIPESINSSHGSITEFAAEITCLFWFESAATLEYAENLPVDALPDRGVVADAAPTLGFRKWVAAILSTTQVGKNVILLALMFIYRLKKFNPSVSGKRGSEFRLLTIALMLGNKFLDDNTYTNKTWAEVSGISVQEIHIMEVEFLSNMRYQLYASQAEWARWKALLGRFDAFYEKASRHPSRTSPVHSHGGIPGPASFTYKLPSPPAKHLSSQGPTPTAVSHPLITLPQLPRSPVRPQPGYPAAPFERKRSLDLAESVPPAKRPRQSSMSTTFPGAAIPSAATIPATFSSPFHAESLSGHRIPPLPMPRLATTPAAPSAHLTPLSMPPSRAMAGVYPNTSTSWSQPVTPISALPPTLAGHFQPPVTTSFADPMRPMNGTGSGHTSPVNHYGLGTPNRQNLSPSFFLTNRSSPYRPVRNVHTLLIPPPSAAMQNTVRSIDLDQIHYQPLGRPATDRRSGPVPYLPMQHSTVSTPTGTPYRLF